jgi:hypothetical protein
MRDGSRASRIAKVPVNQGIADGARKGIDFIFRVEKLELARRAFIELCGNRC